MTCRVSVKFSIGSRSVNSKTTCASLISEPKKIFRTSFTIDSLRNKLTGEIECDLHARTNANGRTSLGAGAAHQIAGHFGNEAAGFCQRDERTGHDQCAVGLAPSHQHLGAAQLSGADIDHRLVVRHKLPCLECTPEFSHRIVCVTARHQESEDQHDQNNRAGHK